MYVNSILFSCIWDNMKKSNNNRSKSQKKRAEKNQKRLSDKTRLSKQQRWEMRERVRILSETLSQF